MWHNVQLIFCQINQQIVILVVYDAWINCASNEMHLTLEKRNKNDFFDSKESYERHKGTFISSKVSTKGRKKSFVSFLAANLIMVSKLYNTYLN